MQEINRRDFASRPIGLAATLACSRFLDAAEEPMLSAMPDYRSTAAKLITQSTPIEDGYYYPAEWEPHESTIMVLPAPQNWKGSGIPMAQVRRQWANVANKLCEYEPVLMVVRPEDRSVAQQLLSREIELLELPVNDGWSRDSGPMVLVNSQGERRVAGFTFNGWGGKFPPFADDALLKARLSKHLEMPMYPIDLVLEGGAVAVDGEGTLLTTEQCLLNPNRNSKHDRVAVERLLNQSLGTTKVIWLGDGLTPDPVTDGHIDGLAAFAAPGIVLLHTTDDRQDPNFNICQDAKRRLQAATDAQGSSLQVIEIPMHADLSHMNFYIANDCLLVPTSDDRRENRRALAILKEAFPNRDVVPINSSILGEGGGGIHCITQQIPQA